jgi:hypothetical protein
MPQAFETGAAFTSSFTSTSNAASSNAAAAAGGARRSPSAASTDLGAAGAGSGGVKGDGDWVVQRGADGSVGGVAMVESSQSQVRVGGGGDGGIWEGGERVGWRENERESEKERDRGVGGGG